MTHEVLHKEASEDFWPVVTKQSRLLSSGCSSVQATITKSSDGRAPPAWFCLSVVLVSSELKSLRRRSIGFPRLHYQEVFLLISSHGFSTFPPGFQEPDGNTRQQLGAPRKMKCCMCRTIGQKGKWCLALLQFQC